MQQPAPASQLAIPAHAIGGDPRQMTDTLVERAFPSLVLIQSVHALEEYAFRFYEVFPPARLLNDHLPGLSRPGFILFNLALIGFGLFSYFNWVRRGRAFSQTVVWIWVGIELYNGIAHVVWGVLIRNYNPGLISALPAAILASYVGYRLYHRS